MFAGALVAILERLGMGAGTPEAPAASGVGRVVCLTGRDRAVTSVAGTDASSATVTGRDRAVTTVTADLEC